MAGALAVSEESCRASPKPEKWPAVATAGHFLLDYIPLDKSQISVILVASSASIFTLSAANNHYYFLMENNGEESYTGTTLLVTPAARSICLQPVRL